MSKKSQKRVARRKRERAPITRPTPSGRFLTREAALALQDEQLRHAGLPPLAPPRIVTLDQDEARALDARLYMYADPD